MKIVNGYEDINNDHVHDDMFGLLWWFVTKVVSVAYIIAWIRGAAWSSD